MLKNSINLSFSQHKSPVLKSKQMDEGCQNIITLTVPIVHQVITMVHEKGQARAAPIVKIKQNHVERNNLPAAPRYIVLMEWAWSLSGLFCNCSGIERSAL